MDPIEKAIRNALEKGNAEDAVFRNRVYSSAESALLRSISVQPNITEEVKQQRVLRLRVTASAIETEFTPAVSPQTTEAKNDEWRVAPQMRPASDAGPFVESPEIRSMSAKKITVPEPKKKSALTGVIRGLFNLIVFLILLGLLAFAVWKFWGEALVPKEFGGTGEKSDLSTSNSSPSKKLGKASDGDEGWISVFAPSDAASVDISQGLTAELMGTGADARMRLTPASTIASSAGASFEVGKGILEKLSGKKVVFDIFAKSEEAVTAEMSVSCELAGMGTCQRTRFRLEGQPRDNLLIVQLSDAGPEASGTITISPDIEGGGKPVEIFSIRLRAEE